MSRKYSINLVDKIREKQYPGERYGVNVIYKPIPDCDIKGAMDPRLYESSKKMARLMKFIPKRFMKINADAVPKLRKPFNNVDSTNFVEGVTEKDLRVKARDGYQIPITIFNGPNTLDNAPILYFIHGGGFFAGSSKVVSEALRYIVKTTGVIAVACDYRLAPEDPFPTGHEDTYSVLEWIYNHAHEFGGDHKNIFVAGDSAGGNLTLYCSNRSIEDNKEYVKGQIILYPTVNMGGIKDEYTSFSLDKFEIYEKHARVLTPGLEGFSSMTDALGEILGTDDLMNKYLTPYVEVSDKMPPTFFTCGEHDTLILETLAYAKKLNDLGVENYFTIYKGLGHAYIDHMGNYPQAEDCAIDMGNFILKQAGRSHEETK